METTTLPSKAGSVVLDFSPHAGLPERIDTRIRMPRVPGMTVHELMDGEQYLAHYPNRRHVPRILAGRTYFFGQDESAFVTEVHNRVLGTLETQGEEAFYRELMPRVVKDFLIQNRDTRYHRQGDIWCILLPLSWEEIAKKQQSPKWHLKKAEILYLQERDTVVFGTGHRLKGKYVNDITLRVGAIDLWHASLGEGYLTAPDHAPRRLFCPTLFARTPYIIPAAGSLRHRRLD